MESTCVDTSLTLNVIPTQHMDVAAEVLVEELHRVNSENKRLTERLKQMCDKYDALQKHWSQLVMKSSSNFEKEGAWRKRKGESKSCINMFGITECSTSTTPEEQEESVIYKKPKDNNNTLSPKVSKILVRTQPSDTSLYVRDGYNWKKYGQKVTKDNPSPRAYFKCSYAPACQVKKKVQRSREDPTVVVATYEGEHNHGRHGRVEVSMGMGSSCQRAGSSSPMAATNRSIASPTTVTLDLVGSETGLADNNAQNLSIQHLLVQQMATSLTADPNFTAALATAISGSILDHTSSLEK